MSLEDAFKSSAVHDRKPKPQYPDGWTPGLEIDANGGTLTASPSDAPPDWDTLLADYLPPGWDASEFEIDPDSVAFTAWDGWGRDDQDDTATSRRQYSFRARVRRKTSRINMDHWRKYITRHKPPRFSERNQNAILVTAWADWQIGKPEGGGWKATVERFHDGVGKTQDRLTDLKPESLYIMSLGDLVEGCSDHYAQQTFLSELNVTQQEEVVTDLAIAGLKALSKYAPKIVVAAVGGNHGEVRKDGKSYTDFSDNFDVSCWRHVRRTLAENPDAYGHISFHLPRADLTQTLDVNGLLIGIAHGHQYRGGTNAVAAADKWWRGQMAGQQPIGDADLLLSGHRHHLIVSRQGQRTFMQAPALDGGSQWFTDVSGLHSPPGTLSFVVSDGEWDHLRVL